MIASIIFEAYSRYLILYPSYNLNHTYKGLCIALIRGISVASPCKAGADPTPQNLGTVSGCNGNQGAHILAIYGPGTIPTYLHMDLLGAAPFPDL